MLKQKIKLSIAVICFLLFAFTGAAFAQGKSNKGSKQKEVKEAGPPSWAPAHGYRAKTRYVYFTEHNFYYDNSKGVYIYLSGKNWEVSASIPIAFRNIDLSAAVKIDLDYEEDDPQKNNYDHKKKYKKD